jgi:vacuolar-type H+-ATPase subunit F/Vma7
MSQLLVVTRPGLVSGFHLAGVNAYGAEDAESAQRLIDTWLNAGEEGVVAIDDSLLARMDASFLKRLAASEHLLHLGIPGGQPLSADGSQTQRVTTLIRQAIGFHITLKGNEESS